MRITKIIVLVLAVVLLGCIVFVAMERADYKESHVFVADAAYPKDAQFLDLRNTGISTSEVEEIRQQLPDCEILWDVPFQGTCYSSDITQLSVSSLTEADMQALDYFPNLTTIDATACADFEQVQALQQLRPDLTVICQVVIGGQVYPLDTTTLTIADADPEELMEKLSLLPELESVDFGKPSMDAESLLALQEAYPEVEFIWECSAFGKTYPRDTKELDFSGTLLDSLEELEADLAYFPELEKVILCDCGIDNDTLAAYRDRVRQQYKVVWSVMVNDLVIRTDELTFMPGKHDLKLSNEHLNALKYCEDMICVDLGHYPISNLDWIYGTPHLQYLVVADTNVSDITPVGTLKELIYFEVFMTDVSDYSPLVGCTALQDANLYKTSGDASVFAQMPWLNNLWINCCGVDRETRAMLIEALPDTTIEFDHGWQLGNNWRALLNYFKMRDLLEMPYYDWGNNLGRPGDPDYPFSEEE